MNLKFNEDTLLSITALLLGVVNTVTQIPRYSTVLLFFCSKSDT